MKKFTDKLRRIKNGVWSDGVKKYYISESPLLNALSKILGTTDEITITANTDGTLTISLPNSIKLDGATASRLLATDSNKKTVSVADLASWIAGTTNRITVTNNGDGTITLSGPQDLAVASTPTFSRLKLSNIYHAYGGFQDKNETITISTVDVWYHITNATNNLWTGLEADGLTLSGDVMTITNTGDYIGNVSISLTGGNGKDFQIRLYNITQATQIGYYIGGTTTGAGNFTPINVPIYIEATAGDQLRMEVRCITDDSDPTFKNAIFWLSYLHE